MSYLVTLDPAARLAPQARMRAEVRFAAVLEQLLDGPQAVPATYRAWQAARERRPAELSQQEQSLAVRWPHAAEAASRAGLAALGEGAALRFEVRVE